MPYYKITVKGYQPQTCEVTRVVRANNVETAKDKLLQDCVNNIFDDTDRGFSWTSADAAITWEEAEETEEEG